MTFMKHELKMNFKALLIWTLVVGGMIFCFMLIFPTMEESMGELSGAYSQMGDFSTAFGMDKINIATPMGFFGIEIGATLSLGGAMFAAIGGIGMLAKEEGGHTTEFVFVTPNKRTYFITSKMIACVILIGLFDMACMILGILGFVCINEELIWKQYLLFFLAQFLMHLEIAGICFGISAFLRKNNIGLGIGIAMLLYFVNLFANITDKVENLHYITPFSYSDAADIFVTEKLQTEYLISGMIVMVMFVLAGYVRYCRKDLNI
ncbi:MAG: ABC transporter permease subunit [Eubacterium sp.]